MVTDDTIDVPNAVESTVLRGVAAMEEVMTSITVNDEPADFGNINISKTINDDGITCKEHCLKNPVGASKRK